MQWFRDMVHGWLGKTLLVIIIVPFAVWGVDSLMTSSSSKNLAAEVNGREVSTAQLERSVENQRRMMLQQMGRNADASLVDAAKLRPQVLDTLIERTVLEDAADKAKLFITQDMVANYVRSVPAFQENGSFSQQQFETVLRNAGMVPEQFVDDLKSGMRLEQLRTAVMESGFVTEAEMQQLARLESETRDISHLVLTADSFKKDVSIGDDEVQKYFDAHQDNFMTKEDAKFSYVEIKKEAFGKDYVPTDDELKKIYDAELAAAKETERRKSSHILITVDSNRKDEDAKKIAEDAKARLDKGEDFSAVAKQLSEDPGSKDKGGDIGLMRKTDLEPEYATALFNAEKGAVIGPVKTSYGYHIIKVTDIEAAKSKSFDEMKADLVKKAQENKSEEGFSEAVDAAERMAFESGDLTKIAKEFNLQEQTSDWIPKVGATGLFGEKKVSEAAFSEDVLDKGMNSNAVEVAGGKSAIVLRLIEHRLPKVREFSEVKPEIVAKLTKEAAEQKALDQANALLEQLRSGKSSADVAAAEKLKWVDSKAAKRFSVDGNFQVSKEAFKLPRPKEGKASYSAIRLANGDAAIVAVTQVTEGKADYSAEELKQRSTLLAGQLADAEFKSMLESLKSKADIKRFK